MHFCCRTIHRCDTNFLPNELFRATRRDQFFLSHKKMATAASSAQRKRCVLCEMSLQDDSKSFNIGSPHELFPGVDTVKAAMKLLMTTEPDSQDTANSPLLDAILGEDDHVCTSCFERLATGFNLHRRIEGAKKLMKFTLREGYSLKFFFFY